METLKNVIDTFVEGDFFFIFIGLMVLILSALIVYILKIKKFNDEEDFKNDEIVINPPKEEIKEPLFNEYEVKLENNIDKAISLESILEQELIKETPTPSLENYTQDEIRSYEDEEEACAIISAEELEIKNQERMMKLGLSDNHSLIEKFEEEQEQKAIISYEELVKNASNLSITYTEETKKEENDLNAPFIKKLEVNEVKYDIQRTYVDEELYLRKLKEFRVKLE